MSRTTIRRLSAQAAQPTSNGEVATTGLDRIVGGVTREPTNHPAKVSISDVHITKVNDAG